MLLNFFLRIGNHVNGILLHIKHIRKAHVLVSLKGYKRKKIFYFNVTRRSNVGDLAQLYCIEKWLSQNYSEYQVFEFDADTIIDKWSFFLNKFKSVYNNNDIIFFQSGFNVNDMGGTHEMVYMMICKNFPNAKMVMMPQTVLYRNPSIQKVEGKIFNSCKNFFFIARDFKSLREIRKMSPDLYSIAYPDITTSLIGSFNFSNKRNGICLCCRKDGENLYSKDDINRIIVSLHKKGYDVTLTDTDNDDKVDYILSCLKSYIERQIESFSKYEITITDRLHGTIFSLCAGTPVILLKSNNFKVAEAVKWLSDFYNEYIYTVDNLDEIPVLIKQIKDATINHNIKPYFKYEYFDKLKSKIDKFFNQK